MSPIEGDGIGLGWEIWFLAMLLAVAGVLAVLVVSVVGTGLGMGDPNPLQGAAVEVDAGRMIRGGAVALAFGTGAAWLIRATDWRLDPVDEYGRPDPM